MKVTTDSERALRSQRMVLELLLSDMPEAEYTRHNEVDQWAAKLGVGKPRFEARVQPAQDLSHPAIAVNLDACIQCTRCLRACRDEQVNDVIGLAFRGEHAKIVFDMDDTMDASTCVACGECVQACPTGALMPARGAALTVPDKQVASLCPFCGVGCQLTYNVKDDKILYVEGRDGPANQSRLCVKGRYGFDYAHHPHRLTVPLIRRADMPKHGDFTMDPERVMEVFREASWEEALEFAGGKLADIRDRFGKKSLAGFGSAKGSNEEAYLFQKLVRTGFGSNNVDHCTRLCHASSVVALLEGIGSGAVSNPVMDVIKAEVVILIGANPAVNHPVAASFIKNAVKNGTKLIVCDPRRSDLSRLAHVFLQFKPDTDVAMLNALMNVIVTEGLVDEAFIASRTIGYDELRANVAAYTPEAMAPICGIDAETLRDVARLYAKSKASMILWGMGISQHVHGTDNARCLIALSLMTGQIGRPGTGLHPLRGQNNVQGASDAGLIPMMYPDYQRVDNPAARARFETAWQLAPGTLDDKPGLTVVEVMHAIKHGEIRGMYVRARTRRCPTPMPTTHARHWPRSTTWSCRTSSLPKPPTWPTSSCRPAPSPKRPAASPTPTGWCRWAARPSTHRAMRGRTCGSSRRLPTASVVAGTTATSRKSSTKCATPCPTSVASPGNGWNASMRSPTRVWPKAIRAIRWSSSRTFRAKVARRASCRPTSSRRLSAPTPNTRWCSSPGASSNIGTPAA